MAYGQTKDTEGALEASTQIGEILSRIADLPEEADDFAASVTEKLESMAEWIEENAHVTPKMKTAIDNMGAAVAKWEKGR